MSTLQVNRNNPSRVDFSRLVSKDEHMYIKSILQDEIFLDIVILQPILPLVKA